MPLASFVPQLIEKINSKTLSASDELKYFQEAQERVKVLHEKRQEASNKLATTSSSSSIFIYTRNRIILHGLPRNRV